MDQRTIRTGKKRPAISKPEVWLDTPNAMRRLFISERTLARWRKQKLIPFTQIGGKYYYREEDIQQLFKKRWRQH